MNQKFICINEEKNCLIEIKENFQFENKSKKQMAEPNKIAHTWTQVFSDMLLKENKKKMDE
jgi:hypothetical protein